MMNWFQELVAETSLTRWVYIILGVLIVALIARILFRRKTKNAVKDVAASLKNKVTDTASSVAETTSAAAATVTSSLGATADGVRPIPSIVSKRTENVSWKDRELFAKTRQRLIDQENPVPELLAEDAPTLNGKNLTFGTATSTLAAMLPQSEESHTGHKRDLQKAGYYQPRAWQNLAAIRYLGIIIPLFLFGILFLFLPV